MYNALLNHRISFFDLNLMRAVHFAQSTYVRNYSSSREILGNLLNIYFELNNQAEFQISAIFYDRKSSLIYRLMNIWHRQPKKLYRTEFDCASANRL